jgi:hypothetical protein
MSSDINHQLGIKASPDEIYPYLIETAKLAQWWTTDTRGSGANVGDTLEFWFDGFSRSSMSRTLIQESGSHGDLRRAKVIMNGRTPKSPSIYRRMRSRPSFSFATLAGERAQPDRVIAR